eukprot:CCRYP_019264-RC/>CCRYP_019264-RC protein AED:0.48 eAED:0.48 QI:0/-1/0/1/-1/0/1/0/10
MDGPTDGPTD